MTRIRGLRWWMISLLMLGRDHQLPHAQHAVGRRPDGPDGPRDHDAAVLVDRRRLSGRHHAAADLPATCWTSSASSWASRSLRSRGRSSRMAHGLAGSWTALFWLRGLLGLAEGSANPAGMKATSEWFPAQERGLAGGVFNIGASFGSMLAPPLVAWAIIAHNWQTAFVLTGALGLVWVGLWLWLYESPAKHPALSAEERHHIVSGTGTAPPERWDPSLDRKDSRATELLGHRPAALPGRSDLGHTHVLAAALSHERAWLRPETDCALRLAAVPCGRYRLPDWGHHQPVAPETLRHEPDQRAPERVHGRGAASWWASPSSGSSKAPIRAIALLSLAGFAHQTLSVTVITMSSDLFKRNEVATVAGMAGTFGNAGVLAVLAPHRHARLTSRLLAVLRRPGGARPARSGPPLDAGARASA